MGYLKFDKKLLVNLEYSLHREILHSNGAGSYSCTTLSGCNTRKYHGLLICPNELLDGGKHVLLSSLDVTVIQHGAQFNLGIHKYPGDSFEPKGHKYISDFEADIIPKTTYRVGGVVLTMERLMIPQTEQVLIRFTLIEANSPTTLRFKPFLAFRNVHTLSHANLYANTKYENVPNGIKIRLYDGYPYLHLQFSKKPEYIHVPDWYNNIEYIKEKNRGYEYLEDLYVPGYFEIDIKKGESVIFSGGTAESLPTQLKKKFTIEVIKKTPRDSFFNCLQNSAEQFFVQTPRFTDIQAGYPWYNGRVNQTFVALPGLSTAIEDTKLVKQIISTNISRLKNGLFPQRWGRFQVDYASVDTPLWFFWSMQKLSDKLGGAINIWKNYKTTFVSILEAFRYGTTYNIYQQNNGLICADAMNVALTWMNAYVDNKPVTPRNGNPVEVNALWYNALAFSLEMAASAKDRNFILEWKPILELVGTSFIANFWNEEKGYLADCIDKNYIDWSIRPNMVIAAAMPHSPLTLTMKKSILNLAKKDLLTPRGLRTLSPNDASYIGFYGGNESERENAMHQGTVFPWLIGFFIEGYLNVHHRSGLPFVKKMMDGFEEEMTNHCIGTISEVYCGNPPHEGKGAISQAWNIGEILRAYQIIENYDV